MNMFPSESPWKLRLKLVTQRHRIMPIAQDKTISFPQVNKGIKDQTVFD